MCYCVELEKLSTDRHGGLPQNRRRLYIVAILEPSSQLEWPSAVPRPWGGRARFSPWGGR